MVNYSEMTSYLGISFKANIFESESKQIDCIEKQIVIEIFVQVQHKQYEDIHQLYWPVPSQYYNIFLQFAHFFN